LLWFLIEPERLKFSLRSELSTDHAQLCFSVLSIWEIAIKAARQRPDFNIDAVTVRNQLLNSGWKEVDFVGAHAVAVRNLPPLHGDPFDRGLVAQALVENLQLVTGDKLLANYGPVVRLV
jgi:PIN domain nuclease of toxin-antitoxin system